MSIKETLTQKLKDKSASIAILGLGYVGLPLAVVFGEAGFNVTGIDPDARKVDSLNKGVSYIPDVKTEAVAKLVKSGHLTATTDFSVLKDMDAVSICVPTPLRQTGDPDMSFIISATEQLAKLRWSSPTMVSSTHLCPSAPPHQRRRSQQRGAYRSLRGLGQSCPSCLY